MVKNTVALPDTPDSSPHCSRLVQLSQTSARLLDRKPHHLFIFLHLQIKCAVILQQSSLCSGAQQSVGSAATTEIGRMIAAYLVSEPS